MVSLGQPQCFNCRCCPKDKSCSGRQFFLIFQFKRISLIIWHMSFHDVESKWSNKYSRRTMFSSTVSVGGTSASLGKSSLKHTKIFRIISSNQKLAQALTSTPLAIARTNINTSCRLATARTKTAGSVTSRRSDRVINWHLIPRLVCSRLSFIQGQRQTRPQALSGRTVGRSDGHDVITKFSQLQVPVDALTKFLTHGAPLARFARRSSAIIIIIILLLIIIIIIIIIIITIIIISCKQSSIKI